MGSALDARGIKSSPDNLVAEVEASSRTFDGVPLITTIRVRYTLQDPQGQAREAERALGVHEKGCPASQSVAARDQSRVQRGVRGSWTRRCPERAGSYGAG